MMKKQIRLRVLAGLLVLMLVTLCGCGITSKDSRDSANMDKLKERLKAAQEAEAEGEAESETEVRPAAEDETESIPEEPEEEAQAEGVRGALDADILRMLDGDWEILDGNALIQEPGEARDVFSFDAASMTATYRKTNGESMQYSFLLEDLYPTRDSLYKRLTIFTDGRELAADWADVNDSLSFCLYLANSLDSDYMMLQELGDERSGFCSDALVYERGLLGTWFFSRADSDPTQRMVSSYGREENIRVKDGSFYAMKWLEFGNSCTLQQVDIEEEEVALFSEPEAFLTISPSLGDYCFSAVNYEYKDGMMNAHDGFFDPSLVLVHTDANGEITSILPSEHFMEGYYSVDFGEE
ncbi:MAG: hypothetical protein IKS87_03650 [Lachnospiraceae bacterium]|nr:hypothetical protein [Lachnospiraceae bacterium]